MEQGMNGVGEVIGNFHTYLLTEKRVSQNTFLAYKRDLEQFDQFLIKEKLKISDVTKKHLNAFLKMVKDQGLSAKTLSRKISSLKLFFNYLSSQHVSSNPAKTLIFPKLEKTLPTYLTEQEIEKLLSAANRDTSDKGVRNKVMLYLLYATGMRVSELVSLTIDQIHFDTGFARVVGKGSKERMIPLPKNILELLRFYVDTVYPKLLPKNIDLTINTKKYLFAACYNNQLKPLSRQSFWGLLKKILSRAAIFKNVSPHSLRHSLATHLLQKGADLRSLQMLLGHQNLATVQVYTHLGNSEIRKVYDKKHPRA
jgi:integrase/recombinase XerD